MVEEYLLGDLAWPDAEKAVEADKVVLLPVGSLEQHGPHLPLDTDTVTAFEVCRRIGQRLPGQVVVLPPVYYTPAELSMEFSGTVDIRPTVFIDYLYDICVSMVKHGFRRMIMVSGHGLNPPFMNIVSQMVTNRHDAICAGVAYFDFAHDEVRKIVSHGAHACEFETSMLLALRPENVKMSRATRDWDIYMGLESSRYVWRSFIDRSPNYFIDRLDRFSGTGIVGDPTKATKEKGERLIDVIIEDMVGFVKEFRTRPIAKPKKRKGRLPK
jgi:creatinine amidohydrolase